MIGKLQTHKERNKTMAKSRKDQHPLDDMDDFEWEEEPKSRKITYEEIKENFPPEIADKFKPEK